MNLEEITTWRYQNSVYVEYNMDPKIAEMFDWLIATVEHQQLIISGKTGCDERKAAALRCIEVVLVTSIHEGDSKYAEGWRDGCDQAAIEIDKEFNLET